MRHNPQTGVFSAYLNQRVRFDVQNAFLKDSVDDGLTRVFTHMSIRCNPLAPKGVPREIFKALPTDPNLVEWERRRTELYHSIRHLYGPVRRAPRTEMVAEYQELGRKIANARKSVDDVVRKAYRKDWFYNSHNDVMARQLNRTAADEYVEPVVHHQLPERTRLQEVLCDSRTDLSIKDIVKRRVRAINLMVELASRQERQTRKKRSVPPCSAELKEESPDSDPTSAPDPFPVICKKTQCIFCIGNETLSLPDRTKSFCRPAIMMDHVEDVHLKYEPANKQVICRHPVCKSQRLVLNNVMHFKNHVARVHGITLRA